MRLAPTPLAAPRTGYLGLIDQAFANLKWIRIGEFIGHRSRKHAVNQIFLALLGDIDLSFRISQQFIITTYRRFSLSQSQQGHGYFRQVVKHQEVNVSSINKLWS